MYELHVEPLTRWYPKHKGRVENGTWQIQRVKVIKYVTPIDDDFYSEYGQITLVGNMVAMEKDGAVYKVKVEKVYNEKRGNYQYDVKYSQEVREFRTEFQQRSFLSMFLNDRQIDGLYALYQNPIQLLEEGNVEEIVKVKGIGEKTALKIIERYEACKDYGPAYGELGSFGLTVPFIQTLIKRYGSADTALDKVKNNPYILADDVKGVGFRKADEIAGSVGIGKHDIKRVIAYIQFYLNDLADSTGSSYTYYDTLLDGIDEFLGTDLPQEVIDEAMQTLIDKEILWYKDEETDDGDINTLIALRKIYECEKSIAKHIRRLVNGDNNIDLDENKIDDLVRPQELKQGWDFTARQKEGIKAIIRNNVVIIRGYGGCVDCDTEYFNGFEWKKISEYKDGDMVLQWNEDGTAELVYPKEYIKLPQSTLYHFETKYGLDQCLSLGHRVVYKSRKGKLKVEPFENIINTHQTQKSGFTGKFITTFNYSGSGIDKTEMEIRLQIAYMADGSFAKHNTTHCTMRLKKERKQKRLEWLLRENGIDYNKRYEESTGFNIYTFYAPNKEKEFEGYWYNCTDEQFKVICDEILHWDGSTTSEKMRFGSTSKKTIDFVQFAFATQGYRSAIKNDNRQGEQITGTSENKNYTHVQQCYGLNFSKRNLVGMTCEDKREGHNTEATKILPYDTIDGYQYCFSVPSTMLVLRRNGKIFITGNTGKSSTVAGVLSCLREDYSFRQCALSGKASVNLRDITGQDGSTIHSLLGYNPGTGVAYHEDNPLTTDMVILDEASMVDIFLFEKLIRAIPTGAKFILLGDTNQLESIGVGNILMDLIDSEIIPVITFDEIHRQGAKSGIIPFSIEIAKGKTRYKDNWVGQEILGELQDLTIIGYKYDKDSLEDRPSVDLIIENFKKLYKECRDISQIAVVVPTKANGTGCYKINQLIQNIVLPPRRRGDGIELGTKNQPFTIYRGDKVINLVNNYEVEPNIFNGNMGEVISIDKDNNKAIIDFYNIGEVELSGEDLKNLDLGYAITCHKSQGSTIPYLIYCLDYSHYVMLNRQQAYTGITRAKKKAIFIIETKAFNRAVRTSKISQKRNFLYHFLTGYLK